MGDKSVRISDEAHKMLQDYTKDNPLYKITMLADLAIKKEMVMRLDKQVNTFVLDRYQIKKQA